MTKRTLEHRQLRSEMGPIVRHLVVVLLIEGCLLIIGLVTQWLERILPEQHVSLLLVEKLDAWTALALLALFGSYTVSLMAIRLWKDLVSEVKGASKQSVEAHDD